jgi:hypothetical protein
MRLSLIQAALLVPILVLGACKPNQPNGDAKGGTQGQAADAVVFPEIFPSYIPYYPGGTKFKNSAKGLTNAIFSKFTKGGSAAFVTTDSADKVLAFYKVELEKAGLKAETYEQPGSTDMMSFVKEEPVFETVSIVISKLPPQSSVVLILYIPMPNEPSQK